MAVLTFLLAAGGALLSLVGRVMALKVPPQAAHKHWLIVAALLDVAAIVTSAAALFNIVLLIVVVAVSAVTYLLGLVLFTLFLR